MRTLYIPVPKWLLLGCTVILTLAMLVFLRVNFLNQQALTTMSPSLFGKIVVIDPGHVGWDPGMKGSSGSAEAQVNLEIAQKLANSCREAGATVIMTRENDQALGDTKAIDMANRVELTANTDIFISVHCNSYPGQHGAQVFYQKGNEEGKLLAESIQQSIIDKLANTDRVAMTHANSYLLKNIDGPAVICETGFLSDAQEEKLLLSDSYQWDMAWAIFSGLIDYLSGK